MLKIGVLASGNGTDLRAIVAAIEAGELRNVQISVVISNKKSAKVLEFCAGKNLTSFFVDPKGKSHESYDRELIEILKNHQVDLVILIGYMKILTPEFIKRFPNKIINVHPALMPKFSGVGYFGKSVHEAVINAGEKSTGCTFHFVDEGVDTGKIILQKEVAVEKTDTPETLKTKVQELEKKYFPEVIKIFIKDQAAA